MIQDLAAPTQRMILDRLEAGIALPPLEIRLATVRSDPSDNADVIVGVRWGERVFEFGAVLKARSTPLMFDLASRRARECAEPSGRYPMVVFPYLRRQQLEALEKNAVSGIDLCGNGVVSIPGQLLVFRTGQPNVYPESSPGKYTYRGTTSLVPRVFLCRRQFRSLGEIRDEIAARGASVTLATVSKALKRMREDVLVERTPGGLRLLQPDGLMEKLVESYQPPRLIRRLSVKAGAPIEEILRSSPPRDAYVLSGATSVGQYAVAGRSDRAVMYCRNAGKLLSGWDQTATLTERFANLELRETSDVTVFFDARRENGVSFASPVQTWLELMSGDKRDREVAEQIRQRILTDLDRQGGPAGQ